MAWAPGNRSGGGVWRTLAAYSVQKAHKAAAQNPILVDTFGVLDQFEQGDTLVATSVVVTVLSPRSAILAVTEASDTLASAATLKIKGALEVTEAADTLSATVGPLLTPTVTNVSASGTAPLILSLSDGDYVAGKYLEWEFASGLSPTTNANGSYTTPTQHGVTFIDGDSWARLDLALGYNDPSGAFSFHCRVLRDNETGAETISYVDNALNTITFTADVGGWGSYTDTITGSVAKLASSTGPNKSRFITVSTPFFQSYHNANVGSVSAARATTAATNSKFHAEFRIDGWNSSGGKVSCGITDGTRNLDVGNGAMASGTEPGAGGTAGMMIQVASGVTSLLGVTIPAAAVGDYIIIEADKATNIVKTYYWSLSANALANSGNPVNTRTLTGTQIPAAWYIWSGGVKGQAGGSNSDKLTFFPETTKMAYSSGYSYYA